MNVVAVPPSRPAPSTVDGVAWYETLAVPAASSRVEALHVHFAPGSRTKWHTHPLGQLLLVTAGRGWAQSRGHDPQPIRAGDVIRVAPDEEHWHGATADSGMSHIAVQEHDDGRGAVLLESVAAADYPAGAHS